MNGRFLRNACVPSGNLAVLAVAVASLVVLAGCGTGGYEERLSGCIRKLNAVANELRDPTPVAGANFTIRLPGTCQAALEGADQRRTNAGPITLPGSLTVYEVMVRDSVGGEQPYYLYVGSVGGGQKLAQVAAELQKQMKTQLTPQGEWVGVQAPTADGGANQWRMLRATGKQVFYCRDKAGAESYPTMDGLLEVYLHEQGGSIVLVAWRMPSTLEANSQLSRWAPLVTGSLKAK